MELLRNRMTKIDELESRIAIMERHITLLQNNVDYNEQYNRRLCLKINGIPPVDDGERQTAEMWLEKVKNVFEKLEVEVPDTVIDMAHRIGKLRIVKGRKVHQVIVRFTTWRHRTLVYRARKKCPNYKYIKRRHVLRKCCGLLEHLFVFIQSVCTQFSFVQYVTKFNCAYSVQTSTNSILTMRMWLRY